jgi:hypothetical protein
VSAYYSLKKIGKALKTPSHTLTEVYLCRKTGFEGNILLPRWDKLVMEHIGKSGEFFP